MPLSDTITVEDAAIVAKTSVTTIRRWCEDRRFPSYKLVKLWRIERKPFYAWIESRHYRDY